MIKSQSSLVDEAPGEWICGHAVPIVPFVEFMFGQIKRVQRKPLPLLPFYQVPTAQNNQYSKTA